MGAKNRRTGNAGGELVLGLAVLLGFVWLCGGFSSRKSAAPPPVPSRGAAFQDPRAASRAMGHRMTLRNLRRANEDYDTHRANLALQKANDALYDSVHNTRR